jgi:hypothetical protein
VLQSFLASRPTPGGAGLPIGYYETIVREARQALKDRGAVEIIVNTRGSDPAVDEYPAVFSFLLNETPHRFVDVTQAARLFPGEANIQIDFAPSSLLSLLPSGGDERGGRERIGQVALREGEQAVEIYAVASYASLPLEPTSAPLARWANGVAALSVKVTRARPGQTATVEVYARLDETSAAAADYHWTNQLFDAQGKRWAQTDAAGYPARYWRRGDIVSCQFGLDLPGDLPPGDYVLRLGQYTYPDVATVPVLDAAGLPQADAFEYRVAMKDEE